MQGLSNCTRTLCSASCPRSTSSPRGNITGCRGPELPGLMKGKQENRVSGSMDSRACALQLAAWGATREESTSRPANPFLWLRDAEYPLPPLPPLHSWHLHNEGCPLLALLLGMSIFSNTPAAMSSQLLPSLALTILAPSFSTLGSGGYSVLQESTTITWMWCPQNWENGSWTSNMHVDMAELVPNSWRLQENDEGKMLPQAAPHSLRGPVKDILLWVDCYTTLVSILTTRYRERPLSLWSTCRSLSMPVIGVRQPPPSPWIGCVLTVPYIIGSSKLGGCCRGQHQHSSCPTGIPQKIQVRPNW